MAIANIAFVKPGPKTLTMAITVVMCGCMNLIILARKKFVMESIITVMA